MSLAQRLRAAVKGNPVNPTAAKATESTAPTGAASALQLVANSATRAGTRATFTEGEKFSFDKFTISDVVVGQDYLDTNEDNRHNLHFIHVSDLMQACPRAYVLAVRHRERKYRSDFLGKVHSSATRVVWAQGRATEEHIRSQFIRRFADQVYGTWTCACKQSSYLGCHNPEIRCGKCQSTHTFNETPIHDHELRIVGTADFPLIIDNSMHLVELKSIKKEDFESLTAPLPQHLTQVFTYHDMQRRAGASMSNQVTVLYAAKEFSVKGAYKEFTVDTTDENYQFVHTARNLLYTKARIIREALDKGTLPERLSKCNVITSSTAKGCPVCVNCFSI